MNSSLIPVSSEVADLAKKIFEEAKGNISCEDFCKQLQKDMVIHHFLCGVPQKDLFKEFNISLDLIGWKSTLAVAVAVMVTDGFDDYRIVDLEGFCPNLRFTDAELIRIFINLNSDAGLVISEKPNAATIIGIRGDMNVHRTPAPALASSVSSPYPF